MAPGVAASKTKKEFFVHLNLVEGDEVDEMLFRKMLVSTFLTFQLEVIMANSLNRTKQHSGGSA